MLRRRHAALHFGAALFFLVGLNGCDCSSQDTIISAVGSYGDIAVLVTDQGLATALEPVQDVLSPDRLFVLKSEETYRFQTFVGKRWRDGRNYRNLLLCARDDRNGQVERAAKSLLGADRYAEILHGGGGVVTVRDPWFRNQVALVAVAKDANRLLAVLNSHAAALAETLTADINRRIVHDNRTRGLMPDPRRRQWARFGFSIELPNSYKENQSEPDGYPGIEWLRNDEATRGVTVTWEDSADPLAALGDSTVLMRLRADLGRHMHHETIGTEGLTWGTERIHGRDVPYLDGNWTSDEVGVGGPFRSYFFADAVHGRLYCVDLLVYAPNRDKMDYVRRQRALLETFSLDEPPA